MHIAAGIELQESYLENNAKRFSGDARSKQHNISGTGKWYGQGDYYYKFQCHRRFLIMWCYHIRCSGRVKMERWIQLSICPFCLWRDIINWKDPGSALLQTPS